MSREGPNGKTSYALNFIVKTGRGFGVTAVELPQSNDFLNRSCNLILQTTEVEGLKLSGHQVHLANH